MAILEGDVTAVREAAFEMRAEMRDGGTAGGEATRDVVETAGRERVGWGARTEDADGGIGD
jgi:hypothetical protein